MIKAIFFDIDGTLVSHTKRDIPEGVLTALDELRAKGILLFIASGRHISEFPALPLHDYCRDRRCDGERYGADEGDCRLCHGFG